MIKQNKFVLNSNLNFIQLKLFDFSIQKPDFEKILDDKLNKDFKIKNTTHKLFLNENNEFSYVNPICPTCDSLKIIKKGIIKRKKINTTGNITKFAEQQYQCKKCGKKFGIQNNPLIKNNKHYLNEITNKIQEIMKNEYQSLRKIAKYFEIFLKIKISHQTIKNWINIDVKDK